jgi:hypothetical protein
LTFKRYSFFEFTYSIQIYWIFICEGIEYIHSVYSLLSPLFEPENQINPRCKTLRYKITLQCFSEDSYKSIRIAMSPRG